MYRFYIPMPLELMLVGIKRKTSIQLLARSRAKTQTFTLWENEEYARLLLEHEAGGLFNAKSMNKVGKITVQRLARIQQITRPMKLCVLTNFAQSFKSLQNSTP